MRIGLTALCVHPTQKTGLPTLFAGFIRESLRLFSDVDFVVFEGKGLNLAASNARVRTFDHFPAADRVVPRLFVDYFRVGHEAHRAGCEVLITNALVPVRAPLPIAMHLLSMHHLSSANRMGGPRSAYRTWATRRGLEKADLIITNTRFACEQILAVDPSVAPKLLQSYEGIDHATFHPRRSADERILLANRFGIEGSYFLWCSNFYPYKNAELLMHAWCALPPHVRRNNPLVMVGGGNWSDSRTRAQEIARSHGAEGDVKMLGWVEDDLIPVLFRHARVFVHPSSEETFGRSVLEAMASGTPCVVQDIPVMREVTSNSAMLIDFRDRELAAATLERALSDEPVRTKLIAAGLDRASQFSFERLASERIDAIHRLLNPSHVSRVRYPAVYADAFG